MSERWTQGAIYDNPYERHLSFWSVDDFTPRATDCDLRDFQLGQYGIFFIRREDLDHYDARQRAEKFATQERLGAAVSSLEAALSFLPPRLDSSLLLVELLVRYGDFKRALERLREAEERFPGEPSLLTHRVELSELVEAKSEAASTRSA